jgi:proteasome accessory factor B
MPKQNSDRRATRNMVERIHYIDNALARKEVVNCSTVGERFGVGRDAVLEDIDQLKRMDRPIDFDPKRNSYYYTEPVVPLPEKIITEGELFTIMVARNALEQYRGTPFFARLSRCFQKLAATVKTKVPFFRRLRGARLLQDHGHAEKSIPRCSMSSARAWRSACR